jgi:predicted unusual protein kinase regulating ubiquinone biosynthesis (AarF/ABC1/UbiB family)
MEPSPEALAQLFKQVQSCNLLLLMAVTARRLHLCEISDAAVSIAPYRLRGASISCGRRSSAPPLVSLIARRARAAAPCLARLGTTFIIGQALSMRQDMLPDEYVAALQSLQDHTTPFPAEKAIREIKRGLGRAVGELLAAEIFNQGQRGPAHRYL